MKKLRTSDSTKPSAPLNYADGQWHRMHPATPLLRGGFVMVAVIGFIIANLRERIVDFFLRTPSYGGDPLDTIYDRGLTGWFALGVLGVVIVVILIFYVTWRVNSFRINDAAVEVRSGLLSRSFRKARLDRIQGINVHRPLFARIFGAAKLEIVVAGHDANVQLAYLGSHLADGLRREILRLASGVQTEENPAEGAEGDPARASVSSVMGDRVTEFINPADLDPDAATPESIVKIHPGRLAGSLVFSGFTIFVLVALAAVIVGASTGRIWILLSLLPGLLGVGSVYTRRFSKALRYSISGTTDGVRVGFGLLATSSETIPPGRIHAVEILQPLMWRPFGWWQIRINMAGHSRQRGGSSDGNTTILPVGSAADVQCVLPLLIPGDGAEERAQMTQDAMAKQPASIFFSLPPRSAAWLRPFSWRRTGFTLSDGVVALRSGAVWRRLVFVPLARMQSVEVNQGPVLRLLDLSRATVHTVDGAIHPTLSVVGTAEALTFFDAIAAGAITCAGQDTSHQWNRPLEPDTPVEGMTQ